MPVSFVFENRKTGNNDLFEDVEKALAEHMGEKANDDIDWCPRVDRVADIGISFLMSGGGSHVEKHHIDKYLKSTCPQETRDLCEWIFLTAYKFSGWR